MKKSVGLNTRKQPAQDRAKETVKVILEGAAQVFSEEGYSATTNRIAQRAGVSIGSLYQYFPNKESILSSLLGQHIQEGYDLISKELSKLMKEGKITRDTLRRLVETMITLHERNPSLHRVLFEQVQLSRFRAEYARNEELAVSNLLLLLKKTPEARMEKSEAALRLLVHAIEAMTHRFVLYGYNGMERAEFTDELTDMMARYLLIVPFPFRCHYHR
jgi:AcrR family transcriptional regulator